MKWAAAVCWISTYLFSMLQSLEPTTEQPWFSYPCLSLCLLPFIAPSAMWSNTICTQEHNSDPLCATYSMSLTHIGMVCVLPVAFLCKICSGALMKNWTKMCVQDNVMCEWNLLCYISKESAVCVFTKMWKKPRMWGWSPRIFNEDIKEMADSPVKYRWESE